MGEEEQMRNREVLPSILSFDFRHIDDELKRMKESGLPHLHYDVMDGHFVSNISFGESLYAQLVPEGFKANVHLMILDPLPHVLKFFQMGADSVLVHFEAFDKPEQVEDLLSQTRKYRDEGRRLGLAINPETDIDDVLEWIEEFDIVMLMTVHPGASGQSFVEGSLDRIRKVRKYVDEHNLSDRISIEVDGGLNGETGPLVVKAGADMLVSGSYLCKAKDMKKTIDSLLGLSAQ